MIRTLMLVNLRAIMGAGFRGGNKRRKSAGRAAGRSVGKMVLIALLVVYVGAAFMFTFGNMFYSLSAVFDMGLGWMYFTFMGIIVFSLCVFTGIFTAHAVIFMAKDNELLLSMPIRPPIILVCRVLALLVFEYAFEAVIAIPAVAVWCLRGYFTVAGFLSFIVVFLLLPLLALSVSCLLAWALALITSRMRRKNIATVVVSLLFMAAYFWFYSNISSYTTSLIANGTQMAEAIRRGFPPVYFLGDAIAGANPVSLLLFALTAVAPFALVCALLSINLLKLLTTNRGAKKIAYRERAAKATGATTALVKKELRYYASNAMIIMNASIGGLFMVAGAVYLLVKRDMILELFDTFGALLGALTPGIAVAVALAALASMNIYSAALISMEGRMLWIARSLPVHAKTILLSKVHTHLVISGLPGVLASIIAAVALAGSAAEVAIILALPLAFTAFMAAAGVALNLMLPKLDWTNEIQPIKQGAAGILLMLGGMALVVLLAALYLALVPVLLTPMVFVALVAVALAAFSALLLLYLSRSGALRFENLSA